MPDPSPTDALLDSWWRDHRGIVVKVLRSFARDAGEAGELEQEMQLQLWLSLRTYAGQAKPSTWIYRVCLNTALTWRRGTGRREARLTNTDDFSRQPADLASPAEQAGDRDLLDKLYAAIHALPPADRALVLLSLDGLPYREISEITGQTENHVGVALTRARQRLVAHLKEISHELR